MQRSDEKITQDSERLFRAVFAGASEALVVTDKEGVCIDANPAAHAIAGLPVGSLLGENLPALLGLASGRDGLAEEGDLTGDPSGELQVTLRDGRVRTVEYSATLNVLPDRDLWMARDVTGRKEAERELQDYRAVLEEAQRTAHIGSWRYDTSADKPTWSREVFSIFGVDPAVDPPAWVDHITFVHTEDWGRYDQAVRQAIGMGTPFSVEFRLKRPDGGFGWAHIIGRANLDDAGRVSTVEGTVQDITGRVEAEEQLRHSQKMEAAGRLAGGMTHDLNNLLTTVLGYADLLLDGNGLEDASRREYIGEMKSAAERAGALMKQISAFSQRRASRPEILDLNGVLNELEPMLRRTVGEDIDLSLFLHPGLELCEVDRDLFENVIVNLVVNARDAMPDGGMLTITTASVDLDENYGRNHPGLANGRYVMVSISDTGIGMSREVMSRMFEPFFTTKPLGQGTGLGLSTVYGNVKQSGGGVWVYSEPGLGTTLKVYFPSTRTRALREPPVVVPPARLFGDETILVVEDEEAVLILTKRILEGYGYKVLVAGDAAEALAVFGGGERIDLLLTDVVLRGSVQGSRLGREIGAALPDLPVLYMSGYARDATIRAGRLEQGVNFLEKPFTREALATMVRTVLDQAHAGS